MPRNIFAIRAQSKQVDPPKFRAFIGEIEPRELNPSEKLANPPKPVEAPKKKKLSNEYLITPRSGQVRSRV